MKKAVAVASASALGVVAAAGGAAGAASAEVVTTPCATFFDQVQIGPGAPYDNWFTDCIPQYGVGKAQFTITSDVPFPAEFVDLGDPGVVVTPESDLAAINDYFAASPPLTSPLDAVNPIDDTPTTRTYSASVVAPIRSVSGVGVDTVPAAALASCLPGDPTGFLIYRVEFGPVFATFSQVIAGEDWSYRVGATPPVAYAFTDGEGYCYTNDNGEYTFTQADFTGAPVVLVAPPFSLATIDPADYFDLGLFPRVTKPALAATGVPATPELVVGAGGLGMLGLGALLVSAAVRRRHRASIP